MPYDIKFAKLVTGETVLGEVDEATGGLKDVATVQMIPTQAGQMQVAILPYGFPFEDEITGNISREHIIYEYASAPEDLKKKYLEARSNIKIASAADLGGFGGEPGGGLIL